MRIRHQIITLLLLLMPVSTACAGDGEYQVKAAMIYNFAKFVEWPADSFGSDNRITFCIAGKSPLSGAVQQVQGKLVKGRALTIRPNTRPDDLTGCQILYISPSEQARLSAYLQQASHHNILTVSDLEHFTAAGGMIGFYEEENRVRFEINQDAAQKHRLQISSQLLNLARRAR
jgi:hypothetical protein